MVYCFQAELAFSTAAARDTVFAALQASVTSQQRFGAEQFEKRRAKFGVNGLFVIMRYRLRSDAVAMRDLLATQLTANPPLPDSKYRIHDCVHDESGSCGVGVTTVF